MERGDTGLGRDAYGLPRRRRLGDRRAYRPDDGPGPTGPDDGPGPTGPDGTQDDEYGQLRRRPGDMPPSQGFGQPGRSRMRPPPGRFPPHQGNPPPVSPADGFPSNGAPADGFPSNGAPGNGFPSNGAPGNGFPSNGAPGNGGPMNAGPADRVSANGGPMPGHQYRLPNGRRVPPRADRPYPPRTPGPAGGRRGTWDLPGRPQAPGPSGQGPPGGWGRPPRPQAPGPQAPGPDAGRHAYGNPPFAGSPAGSRPDGRDGWGRLGTQTPRGVPAGTAAPVIRQRENAVPDERTASAAPSAASIAPDGLESFARDLRALRAKAELDYPEMAEVSHYTMKTLASAAGGLRLPALPVAVAYVRACGGNVAEWEERWQKLAAKITADAARKHRGDGDERQVIPEPAGQPAIPEPPAPSAAQDSPAEPGEVYVITSARPRQPGW